MNLFLAALLLALATACQPVTDGASGLHIVAYGNSQVTVTQHVAGSTTSTPTTTVPTSVTVPVSAAGGIP